MKIKPNQKYVHYGMPQPRPWSMPRWLGVAITLIVASLFFSRPTQSQLNQSNGAGSNASVGTTGATAPGSATLVGGTFNTSLPTLTNGQMGSLQLDANARGIIVGAGTAGTAAGGVVTVQGVAGGTTLPVSGSVSVSALPSLATGSNVIGTVNTIPKTACGNTVASQALAAVPTSSTAVFSSTTCLEVIILNNTNATSATVTVTDNAGTPINDVLTFSIPGNSQLIQPLWGVAFTTGMKWSASTTGITGAALGYQ